MQDNVCVCTFTCVCTMCERMPPYFNFLNCCIVSGLGSWVYVVCDSSNHYAGRTSTGHNFLQANPHIPVSFMVSTNPG